MAYLLRRTALAAVLVLAVVTLLFVAVRALPGDPVLVLLGPGAGGGGSTDPAVLAALRHDLGLDRPLPVQYAVYVRNLARLDLGKSIIRHTEVRRDLSNNFPRTFELALVAVLLGVLFGIPGGVAAAVGRDSWLDRAVSAVSAAAASVPPYVFGTLAVLVFALFIPIFPASGYVPWSQSPGQHLLKLSLPAVTLGLRPWALVVRMTRSTLLETLNADFIRTARAKGLTERAVLFKHALRSALIPVTTAVGLQFGSLLGGAVLVETIFNWPGLGQILVDAALQRDYPMIQGVVLVTSTLFILTNVVVDFMYGLLDPRIRHS